MTTEDKVTTQSAFVQKLLNVFPVERVVAFFLTPVLVVAAPWVVSFMSTYYPGVDLTSKQVSNVTIATISSIVLLALKWLHGRQNPALLTGPKVGGRVLTLVQQSPPELQAVAGPGVNDPQAFDRVFLDTAADPPIPPATMPPPGTLMNLDAPSTSATGATPGAPV